ncbi:MAG: YbhB/YbcL family Raf kinase inhibitor-like protein, partial [Gemmatimonadales bacterium]
MRVLRLVSASAIVAAAGAPLVAQNPPPPAPPGQPAPQGRGGGRGRGAVRVMTLTSPSFNDGAQIPPRHAQPGHDVSPPLAWIGVPDSTKSFVLIVHDLDAATGNGTDDVLHWMVWNIPGTATSLAEGVPQGSQLADGSRQISVTGPNYRGPAAPASGPAHHYAFELYALDVVLDVPAVGVTPAATRAAVLAAMAGHVRGKAATAGLYRRPPSAEPGATGDTLYDVVIRNGRVLDGEGSPWILADVAIKDGRFAKLGKIATRGRTEIDARGKYVSPGWIDMMDQSGGVLPRAGLAENKLQEGVTTAIGGEGGTPAPAAQVGAYFEGLERNGISINFGSYFSETQARVAVLGQSARPPTAAELERMRAIMDTAMRGGAMGMTTALIYPPSSYSTTDELVEVARAAAKYGGTYASHIRGEGKEVVQAVNEAIAVGERAGLAVEVFHLKVADRPSWGILMDSVGRTVEAARARGVDVAADLYVYTAGGTGLEATIPSWAHEGGTDSLKARLANPAIRARLKRELKTGSPGWWNI